MIYAPLPAVSLLAVLGGGLQQALQAAAIDFVASENKPWTYYTGVFLGGAIATTIPGGAAFMYAVGDTVDVWFFHSPDGSDVRVFLDGVAAVAIDTFNPIPQWIKRSIYIGSAIVKRVDMVNNGLSTQSDPSALPFMAFSQLETVDAIVITRTSQMASIIVSVGVRDGSGGKKDKKSTPYFFERGTLTLAQIEFIAQNVALKQDAVIDGVIENITFEVAADLPAGLKTVPIAQSEVEKGALFSLNAADTRYAHEEFVPTFTPSKFSGDDVLLTAVGVSAYVSMLTLGLTDVPVLPSGVVTVRPTDKYGNALTGLRKATKRFRK